MAMLMEELAKDQPGYLGIESARSGIGITVSYWATVDAIKEWKNNLQHQVAQKLGKEQWYSAYKTRICLVERDYEL
jgi:heme-degrading monooxygenase HmoA